MIITSLEWEDILRRSGKGFITSLGLTCKVISKKYKKSGYAIRNFIKKELSNIIREIDKPHYKSYEIIIPKDGTTDIYLYPSRQLVKCMMRADVLNLHIYPVRTELIATKQILTLHVCSTDKSKLKYFLVDETLSQICYMDRDESKGIIFNKCLRRKTNQNVFTKV